MCLIQDLRIFLIHLILCKIISVIIIEIKTMKKQLGIIGGVVVVIIAVVLVMGTKGSDEPEALKIGVMLPLSGEYAWAGENIQRGVEFGLAEYKAAHPDIQIELVVEDDGFDVQKGIAAYRKLVEVNSVDAIIMVSTPVIDAMYETVVTHEVPVMQLGIQTTGIADDNIFQTSPSAEAPIEQFAQHLLSMHDFAKTAVFYDNTAGGLQFKGAFEKTYTDTAEYFVMNDKEDVRGYALRVAEGEYDAVVFLTSPTHGALLVKEILAVDTTAPFFAFDAQLQSGFGDYERILGDIGVLNGAKSLWLKGGNPEAFNAAYEAMYGVAPGFFADFGYDTFNILIGSYDNSYSAWLQNIQTFKGDLVSGPLSFDDNGVRIQPIVIQEVREGKLVELK